MRKISISSGIVGIAIVLAVAAVLFYSCSGGGSSGIGKTSTSSAVALYATDCISDFKGVTATINKVTLMDTSGETSCVILSTPTTINIANLSNVLDLLNIADCPPANYNRIHIEFNKSVELMDHEGSQSSCSFTSYKNASDRPYTLQCNDTTCSLDISGAVYLLESQNSSLALDFKLNDFDIDSFGTGSCSVTMKVSPIDDEEFRHSKNPRGITGLISNLSTSTDTFDLTKHERTFSVLYSGITSSQQPGLEFILQRAQQSELKTRVTTSTFDHTNSTITASAIIVKAEGLVSNLTTTGQTFTLTSKTENTMTINFSKAIVNGILTNGAWVEVKLYGADTENNVFLARQIDVEHACSIPDDEKTDVDTDD